MTQAAAGAHRPRQRALVGARLLGGRHRFSGFEDAGVAGDVLDVGPRQQVGGRDLNISMKLSLHTIVIDSE